MSDSFPSSSSETTSLYDLPPEENGSTSPGDDSVSLRLSMSKEQAEQFRAVSQQIGLSPSTLAERAIEMVCDEVVVIQDDTCSPSILVQQYQARIDLLHAVKQAQADESASEKTTVPETAAVEEASSNAPADDA